MCGIIYLDMKEVAEKLKMKSADAAARWCIDKNIEMMMLGNKRVVSEFDFRVSFEKPIIDMLKKKYDDNWVNYYEVYKSEDVIQYYELEKSNNIKDSKQSVFNPGEFLKNIGYGKS
jgi:hypothetical protein